MSKQIIPEVAILRLVALFLVMLGHSLSPFAGFWDKIPFFLGRQKIPLYWWLGQPKESPLSLAPNGCAQKI